jgi:alpha-glucosidase
MTINGTSTNSCAAGSTTSAVVEKRGIGAGGEQGVNLNSPPYAIHNGKFHLSYARGFDLTRNKAIGSLNRNTLATNATHFGGYAELDVHNMFGFMEEKTTHLAVQSVIPGKRPFLISRSTFPSAGKWTGHWVF